MDPDPDEANDWIHEDSDLDLKKLFKREGKLRLFLVQKWIIKWRIWLLGVWDPGLGHCYEMVYFDQFCHISVSADQCVGSGFKLPAGCPPPASPLFPSGSSPSGDTKSRDREGAAGVPRDGELLSPFHQGSRPLAAAAH